MGVDRRDVCAGSNARFREAWGALLTYTTGHAFILSTILFTVYSQLIMRWQVGLAGPLPDGLLNKTVFLGTLLLNPWVLSGIVATFLGGVSWMLVMTRFEISYAYPFVSLSYILVLVAGVLLFNESFSVLKAVGTLVVVGGLIIIARN